MFFIDELQDFKMYKKQFLYPIDGKDKKNGSAVILLSPNMDSSIGIMNHDLFLSSRKFIKSYYIEKAVLYYIQQENGIPTLKQCEDIVLNESLHDYLKTDTNVIYSGEPTDIYNVSPIINANTIKKFAESYKIKVKFPLKVNIYRKTIVPESKDRNINVSSVFEYGNRIYKNYNAYLNYQMMEYVLKTQIKSNNKFTNSMIVATCLYESGLYEIHKNSWIFDPRLKTLWT